MDNKVVLFLKNHYLVWTFAFLAGIYIGLALYIIGFAMAQDGIRQRKELDRKNYLGMITEYYIPSEWNNTKVKLVC